MEIPAGTILAGRYRVEKVLGQGATGVIHAAHDLLLGETVALKVLRQEVAARPERVRRFRREIRLARRVTHSNVCRIFEYVEDGPRRFYTMEFVEGTDLRQVVRRQGALPAETAYDVALQVAAGLEAIHAAGIVHRDLTARNVLCDASGRVKLTGFGFARRLGSESSPGAEVAGTPEYMSPEQARGERVDARSDLYGLGILVFEMLTGAPPFHGATSVVTLFQQMYDPPPLTGAAAARLPLRLVPVLEKALAKRREERYASAAEMADALREARSASQVVAMEPGPVPWAIGSDAFGVTPGTGTLAARGRPLRLLSLAAALAVAAGGTWLYTLSLPGGARRTPPASPPALASVPAAAASLPRIAESTPAGSPTAPARTSGPRAAVAVPAAARTIEPPPTVETPEPVETVELAEPPIAPAPDEEAPEIVARGDEPGPPGEGPGRLQIGVRPWAIVSLDGRPIGETPLAPVTLAPGVYTARLEHPGYRPLVRKVTVRPGETVRLKVDLGLDGIPR